MHRRQRLARDLRLGPGRDPYDLHRRAVARRDAARARNGQIRVGREPRHPARDRRSTPPRTAPTPGRARRSPAPRPPGRRPPSPPARAPARAARPAAPPRRSPAPATRRHLLADQPRHGLRRGDDVLRPRRACPAPSGAPPPRPACRSALFVTYASRIPPARAEASESTACSIAFTARVHHPVEVEQSRVVRLAQGLPTALGPRPAAPAHSASLLARSAFPRSSRMPPTHVRCRDEHSRSLRGDGAPRPANSPRSEACATTPTGSAASPP